jgi:hypothetical protein
MYTAARRRGGYIGLLRLQTGCPLVREARDTGIQHLKDTPTHVFPDPSGCSRDKETPACGGAWGLVTDGGFVVTPGDFLQLFAGIHNRQCGSVRTCVEPLSPSKKYSVLEISPCQWEVGTQGACSIGPYSQCVVPENVIRTGSTRKLQDGRNREPRANSGRL